MTPKWMNSVMSRTNDSLIVSSDRKPPLTTSARLLYVEPVCMCIFVCVCPCIYVCVCVQIV